MQNTKKSLLTSALSMLLCVAMLLGTTFAWFTDSATNTGNRILAGNLKVDLLMDKTETDNYVSIKNSDAGDIFNVASVAQNDSEKTLWEPGKTQIVYLAVENDGNLALKYEIMLNVTDYGLADALEYAIFDEKKASDNLENYGDWLTLKATGVSGDVKAGISMAAENGKLAEKGDIDYFALAVHMKEEAGNDYMDKDIIIDVAVNATQVDEEADSFGTSYDKGISFDDTNRAKLPARAAAKIDVDEATNTLKADTTLTNNKNVTATVPAGVKVEDDTEELVLNITRTDVPANVTVGEDEAAEAVEITIDGLDGSNNMPIVIEVKGMFAKNLNNVKMYHKDVEMTKVSSAAAVANHNEFYYDAATGDVTLATKTFSPFTMISDVEGVALPKALVTDITAEAQDVIMTLNGWGSNVDAQTFSFDKAYSFKATQTADEIVGLPYENWNADFVISCDKNVPANSVVLGGYYASWCDLINNGNWLGFTADMEVEAGQAIRLLSSYGIGIKYSELCSLVEEFKCGAADVDGQNKGTTITVELRLYERVNGVETGNSYLIGSFNYTF